MENNLEEKHNDFIHFFRDNNIVCILLSSTNEIIFKTISCDTEKTSIENIKKIILDLKIKYVYIEIEYLELIDEPNITEFSDKEDVQRFKELQSLINLNPNSILEFNIYIQLDGTILKLTYKHNDFNIFEEYKSLYDAIHEMDEDFIEDDINLKKLSKEQITSLTERLLKEEDYIKAYNASLRRNFIYDFFEKELTDFDIDDLIYKAELALDKFLISKIKEMRKEGKRKVDVMSELGISKHRVDKYY